MATLVDTNVLGRRAQPSHPVYAAATRAIDRLIERGEPLFVAVQNLMEFWSVATRPVAANGLGLSPERSGLELDAIEQVFELLPETAEVYPAWRRLVREAGVSERQVHDAHLAATMLSHGVTHILTFNTADFTRTAASPRSIRRAFPPRPDGRHPCCDRAWRPSLPRPPVRPLHASRTLHRLFTTSPPRPSRTHAGARFFLWL